MKGKKRQVEETLYLGFLPGRNYGWGIAGERLISELSKKTKTFLIGDEVFYDQKKLYPGKLIQPLIDEDLNPYFSARGIENFGYAYFDADPTKNAIKNASEYNLILTGSSWSKNKLQEYGVKNTASLLQGIDKKHFYPIKEKTDGSIFTIFSGGRFALRKGQDILLKAFKTLHKKYNDMVLLNCWYNAYPESMRTMLHSPHIEFEQKGDTWWETMENIYLINDIDPARVITLPMVNNQNLREIYKFTDIGVFPSRSESGTNLMLMEYMACEKPAIATNTSGHKDIINESNAILLNDLEKYPLCGLNGEIEATWETVTPDELIDTIEYAYHNRDKLNDIAKQGAKDMTRFTWESCAEKLLEHIAM